MTFGEMQKWTNRFNQIIGGAQCMKNRRLSQMRDDLAMASEGKKFDPYYGFLYAALTEEMGA